jgi:hypothetical protein
VLDHAAVVADPKTSSKEMMLALAGLAVGAFLLRVAPFLRFGGALSVPLDYDEGVYFSAGALWPLGIWGYRDFVFAHPPGVLYLFGGWSALFENVSNALAASRWLVAAVGSLNVALVGCVVARWRGPLAGFVAAALYATYGEVVIAERGPFLEPWLNLACLVGLLLFARWQERPTDRRLLIGVGVAMGVALSVKLWALFWVVALAIAIFHVGRLRSSLLFLTVAAGVAGAICLPFIVVALAAFVEQVLSFHLWRPADASPDRLLRLREIAGLPHLAAAVFALAGLLRLLSSKDHLKLPQNRLALAGWALTLGALLASKSYWSQYNAHLALAEVLLGGVAAAWFLDWARARWSALHPVVAALTLGLLAAAPGAVWSLRHVTKLATAEKERTEWVRSSIPASACAFSFEPGDTLLAGRLPPHGDGAPVVLDTYATQLLDATRGGQRFTTATDAFLTDDAQATVRKRLEACRYLLGGWRMDHQLNASTKALLTKGGFTDSGHGVWVRQLPEATQK